MSDIEEPDLLHLPIPDTRFFWEPEYHEVAGRLVKYREAMRLGKPNAQHVHDTFVADRINHVRMVMDVWVRRTVLDRFVCGLNINTGPREIRHGTAKCQVARRRVLTQNYRGTI